MAFPIGNEIGVFQRNFSMGLGYIGQLYVVRALNVVCYVATVYLVMLMV